MKNKKRKSFIAYVHKGHFEFAGNSFMGFVETLGAARRKNEFYTMKVRYTIEEV
jgi:hypothetical protein